MLAAHCNCVAGLGESCSYVASLVWEIEAGVRLRNSMMVTQKRAYWVMPSSVKDVPYAPLKDILFVAKAILEFPGINLGINQDQVGNIFQNILPQQAKKLNPSPQLSFVSSIQLSQSARASQEFCH